MPPISYCIYQIVTVLRDKIFSTHFFHYQAPYIFNRVNIRAFGWPWQYINIVPIQLSSPVVSHPITYFYTDVLIYCNFSKLVIKKFRKLHFFKWQLPFLTLDINVKFNFKATFINIVYIYSQPFWCNFYFLNKIFFFLSSNCFI
jgi:hypothetical protein